MPGCLGTLELSPILDIVALRQLDLLGHGSLDILHVPWRRTFMFSSRVRMEQFWRRHAHPMRTYPIAAKASIRGGNDSA